MKKTLLILLLALAFTAQAEPLLGLAIRKLYPNAEPGVDYIIRAVGAADPTITYWNPAIGAQPDAGQIAAAVALVNEDAATVANESTALNSALTKITGSTPLTKNDIRAALAALLRQKLGATPSAGIPTNDNTSGDPVSWGAIIGTLANQSDLNTSLAATTTADAAVQAFAIARANHTGTQLAATISNFTATASAAAPVQSVSGRTGAVTLTSADVGLGNVNNTADTAKPVSTAQQAALDLKANRGVTALVPVTGGTVTMNTGSLDEVFYLAPAGTLATQTFLFPANGSSAIGQRIHFFTTATLTAVTLSANGNTIKGTLTTLTANGNAAFVKVAASTWARVQ